MEQPKQLVGAGGVADELCENVTLSEVDVAI